jgi:hypothetical protein
LTAANHFTSIADAIAIAILLAGINHEWAVIDYIIDTVAV